MTSIFSLPFLITLVYLFLLSGGMCLSQTSGSAIDDVENQLFFRQYDGEAETARLARIENYIFGQTYSDSIENRIARIKTSVPANQNAAAATPQNSVSKNSWAPQPANSAPVSQPNNDDGTDMQNRQVQVMAARANQVNTLLSQAVSLYRQKQFKEAIDLFEQVIRLDPQNAPAHFSLGIALEANGEADEAASEYSQAATIDPENKDYQQATQNLKNKQERESKTKIEDSKWQALASQAADALKNGQFDQALVMYKQLVEKDPHQPLYQYNLGTIYLMLKQPNEALPHYKTAHKLEPTNTVYEQSLLKLEQSLKEVKEAKEKIAKQNSPKKIDLYANFGLEVRSSNLGVMVKKLKPRWRAAQAGLYPEDIIKTVDGTMVNSVSQLEQLLGNKPIGQRFQMAIVRRGMACQLLF